MSLEDEMRALIRKQRAYASFREGGTKSQKELTVLRDLLEAMAARGAAAYSDPMPASEDPPDCTALNRSGKVVAFEVTELVSQLAVEENERARPAPGEPPPLDKMVMACWTRETMLNQLATILASKDRKSYRGGPYAECVVIIHTDEPLLVRAAAERWLSSETFGPYRQLTGAYLLFSYEPGMGYPYQVLALGASLRLSERSVLGSAKG